MNTKELIEEALKLPKKEKNALINALLQSMSGRKPEADEPKMPVYRALFRFSNLYRELKGTEYSGCFTPENFRWTKDILDRIFRKAAEGAGAETAVITDEIVMSNFEAYVRAVAAMPNRWYFENRFTPAGLSRDFEKIYSQIKSNNGHERAKRAFDYL